MNSNHENECAVTNDPEFISPKIDYAFKQMMNSETALRNFLSAVLKVPEKEINEIHYVDTHTLKEYEDDKYVVMDVRISLKDKCEIDIEMQMMNFRSWTDRVVYYSSRMLSEQIKKGQGYVELIKCISISILSFKIFDKCNFPKYYSSYHIREDEDYRIFNDLFEYHIIELPKISEKNFTEAEDDLLLWASFMNSDDKEEMKMLSKKNHGIKAAYDELEALNNDEERRAIYEAREKAIMDYNVQNPVAREERARSEGKKEGKIEGRKEEKIEIAKKLLRLGATIETVKFATDLDDLELKNLVKEINKQ